MDERFAPKPQTFNPIPVAPVKEENNNYGGGTIETIDKILDDNIIEVAPTKKNFKNESCLY